MLHPRRAEGVLDAMTDPVDRRVGRALLDARTGMARSARTQLEGVLRSHPQHREAHGEWLRLASAEIRAGLDVERVVVAPLDTLIVAAQLLGKRNPRRQSLADAGLALARSLPADAAHDSLCAHAVRELELRRAGRADGS